MVRVISEDEPSSIELVQRKALHMRKQFGTDNFTKASRHPGREENADDRSQGASQGDHEHQAAGAPDVAGILFNNAVIDNIRHQRDQVQVRQGLPKGEHHHENEYGSIRFHKPQ